jgi:hypothetical protein
MVFIMLEHHLLSTTENIKQPNGYGRAIKPRALIEKKGMQLTEVDVNEGRWKFRQFE